MTLYFLLIMNPVKAKCKHCGKDAASDQFRLHYQLRMMVCPACYSGKPTPAQQAAREVVNPSHPPGWDKEDEYLVKMARIKQEQQPSNFSKIPGTEFVKYTCTSCKYTFRHNPINRQPGYCPYCNMEIAKIKIVGSV